VEEAEWACPFRELTGIAADGPEVAVVVHLFGRSDDKKRVSDCAGSV
jgi:hypothetical protein